MKVNKINHYFIISTFVILYVITSTVSTIHMVDFFGMSNPKWLAISLAVAFEVGAAASLASIITLEKMNKGIVWGLFILLTAMQAMGNTYYTYVHLQNFQGWIELFGLIDEELIYQKRILSIVSGAILPLVALGFIKSLVDYIRPDENTGGIDAIIDDGGISKYKNTMSQDELIEAGRKAEMNKIWESVKANRTESPGDLDEPTALANSQYRDQDFDDVEEHLDEYSATHHNTVEHITPEENTTETKVDNIVTVPLQDADLARGKSRISFKGTV